MSKLLQEAIADAKAVRETALANARLALEEAFTPKIQSMISRKLQAEMEDDEENFDDVEGGDEFEDDEELSEELDSSEIGQSDNKEPDADARTSSEADRDIKAEANGEEFMDDEEDLGDDELGGDLEGDEEGEDEFEDDEEESDLDDIIAELEAELYSDEEDEEEFDDLGEEEGEEEFDDLGGEEPAGEDLEDLEGGEDEEEEDSVDLAELLRVISEMDDEYSGEDEFEGGEEEKAAEIDELKNEVKKLRKELSEYRDAVIFMKGKLNEVNLLNAKLLFANKIFRSYNLTNEQKVKVIETLDRTKSPREVKLVYSTLAESFRMGPKAPRKRVVEGLSSKPVRSTAPSKEIISEANDMAKRFMALAGIKK